MVCIAVFSRTVADCGEADSAAEQREASAELFLRGRPLYLWVAPTADWWRHDCVVVTPSPIPIRADDRASVIAALQSMCGVTLVVAVTIMAEIGDF
jgi:hypothetical protein